MRFLPFIAAGAALALASCALDAEPKAPRRSNGRYTASAPKPSLHSNGRELPIHGIDVSKYQGDIDWRAVASAGTKFAWIKATEGGDRFDEYFTANWNGAKAAGVPRGAYHFAYWCRPASQQVEWFRRHVPKDPDALPPVLDVEWVGNSRTCPHKLPAAVAQGEMLIMLTEMERYYGKRPVIYSTVDFYEDVLAGGALSEYPIWVRSTKYEPHIKYGSRKWHFWQYQSDGNVPGINAQVDRNAFHGTHAQWEAFLNGGNERTQTASVSAPVAAPPIAAAAPPPVSAPAAVAYAPAPTAPVPAPRNLLAGSTAAPLAAPLDLHPPVAVEE